jgi:hypothetical protein
MIAVPPKSNYSKPELFDYFIPLEKSLFVNKSNYSNNQFKTKYDESFAKNTFRIYPTIISFLTAMELSDTTQYNWNERMNLWLENIYLQPLIAPMNHNTQLHPKHIKLCTQ